MVHMIPGRSFESDNMSHIALLYIPDYSKSHRQTLIQKGSKLSDDIIQEQCIARHTKV